MMSVSAGARCHVVGLLEPDGPPVSDGEGGYTQAYAPLEPAEAWAEIKPATARALERLVAGTDVSSASHIVTIPYHAGVTTKTRVTFGARTFYVVGVSNPDERNIETIMVCNEMVA